MRPPHLNRCGEALAPVHQALSAVLEGGEGLAQVHRNQGVPAQAVYRAVNEDSGMVREVATIACEDGIAKFRMKAAKNFGKAVPKEMKQMCDRVEKERASATSST